MGHMMSKVWASLLVIVAMGFGWATPAAAKSYGPRSPEMAACLIGAITWDGANGQIVADIVVKTKPFPGLAVDGEKPLRTIVRKMATDSQDIVAVAQFGKWCKAHFPKVAEVRKSRYEVGP